MATTWMYVHGAVAMPAAWGGNASNAAALAGDLLMSPGIGEVIGSGKTCEIPVIDFDSYTWFYAAIPTPTTLVDRDLYFDTLQIDFVTENQGYLQDVALWQGGDDVAFWDRSFRGDGSVGVAESQTVELGTWSREPEPVYTRQAARNGTLVWMKFTARPPKDATAYVKFFDLGIGFSDQLTTVESPSLPPGGFRP